MLKLINRDSKTQIKKKLTAQAQIEGEIAKIVIQATRPESEVRIMYTTATEIAAKMLGCDEGLLHYKFIDYVNAVEGYVNNAGGSLFSRQLIAKMIVDWQERTGEKAKSE